MRSIERLGMVQVWAALIIMNLAGTIATKSHESVEEHKPSRQAAKGGITAYDQRQTGKFNIHLNIKDVQLISLKGDRFGAGVGVSNSTLFPLNA